MEEVLDYLDGYALLKQYQNIKEVTMSIILQAFIYFFYICFTVALFMFSSL
jgi:hypothetical protein